MPTGCARGKDQTELLDQATDEHCVALLTILLDRDYNVHAKCFSQSLQWLRRRGFVFPTNLLLTPQGRAWILERVGH